MFESARVRLTLWYLFIIMIISGLFSAIIFRIATEEMDRFTAMQRYRIERRLFEGQVNTPEGIPRRFFMEYPVITDLVEESKRRLLFILGGVNGAIFVLAGGLAYFLAGRTLNPIEKMLNEQRRFVADASHELKTPLTSLKTGFEVYLRDRAASKKDADVIIHESLLEVNKLEQLSDSLLTLATTEEVSLPMEAISVKFILMQVAKKLAPVARKKKITITVPETTAMILGNENRLVELFTILVDNALKFSPQNDEVEITTRTTRTSVVISVIDHGPGIDKKDRAKIFKRFYRTDQARSKPEAGGYGLGLAIAKQIVNKHHGSIEVESVVKKGSTFTVKLPKGVNPSKRTKLLNS